MNIPDPIEEIPRFEGTLDPLYDSKLTAESDRILARMFNRQEQTMHWIAQHLITAHNLGVETAQRFAEFTESHDQQRQMAHDKEVQDVRQSREKLLKTVLWITGLILAAVFEELVRRIAFK